MFPANTVPLTDEVMKSGSAGCSADWQYQDVVCIVVVSSNFDSAMYNWIAPSVVGICIFLDDLIIEINAK